MIQTTDEKINNVLKILSKNGFNDILVLEDRKESYLECYVNLSISNIIKEQWFSFFPEDKPPFPTKSKKYEPYYIITYNPVLKFIVLQKVDWNYEKMRA